MSFSFNYCDFLLFHKAKPGMLPRLCCAMQCYPVRPEDCERPGEAKGGWIAREQKEAELAAAAAEDVEADET